MSNAQTTHSGDAHCGLPSGIMLFGDESRDDQHSVVTSPGFSPIPEQSDYMRPRGPTPVDAWEDAEDLNASNAFARSLAEMDDDEVLASILRLRHSADVHRDVCPMELQEETLLAVDGPATVEAVQATAATQAPVMAPDDVQTPPGHKLTCARGNENEAPLLEKRRRVQSEPQPESPTVSSLRLRAPLGTITNTSSSTAATRTEVQLNTAAAAAPSHENKGAVVVESNERITDGVDEMPIASLALPAALSPPARQPCDRAVPSPDVRRSKRVAILAAVARKRAAAAVRAAVKAVPVARLRRQSVIARGNGRGEGRA